MGVSVSGVLLNPALHHSSVINEGNKKSVPLCFLMFLIPEITSWPTFKEMLSSIQEIIKDRISGTVVMYAHVENWLQIMFSHISAFAVKLFINIPLLMAAQGTSLLGHLLGHKKFSIQLSGSHLFTLNYAIFKSGSPYMSYIFSTPKCTSFPRILITGSKRDIMIRLE